MAINSISFGCVSCVDNKNKNFQTLPIEKKQVDCQDNVQTSIYGEKASFIPWQSYIPFGAPRPTNNPADLPKIEADSQSGFKLSTLNQPVICPDCGKPVMTKPIFAGIKSELDAANDKTYCDVIEKHSEFLYPQERKILTHIEKVMKKNPDMTIRDVVAYERELRLDKLEDEQIKVLDKISEMAEVLPYEDRSRIDGLIKTSSMVIFERQNNYAFQRGKFLELAEGLKLRTSGAKEELIEIASNLPSSMNNEDAWFVKYGGVDSKKNPYTSRVIAEKLVSPTYTNTDHIHPWNLGGYDATSNFWLMHARCNIIKTDKPFVEWLNEDRDNRVKYIKEYLVSTQEAIDNSKDPKMHPKYDLYAAKIAKTIWYETNGEVDFTEDFPLPEGYDVPRPTAQGKNSDKKA